jgi:hypothetical protein
MNETQRVKAIKALVEKGDKAKDKSDQYYTAAGIHLKALKETGIRTAAWEKLVRDKCGIGRSRAYELIAIADGRKTVAKLRLTKAESMRKHAAANKAARKAARSSTSGGQNPSTSSGQNLPAVVGQKAEPKAEPKAELAQAVLDTWAEGRATPTGEIHSAAPLPSQWGGDIVQQCLELYKQMKTEEQTRFVVTLNDDTDAVALVLDIIESMDEDECLRFIDGFNKKNNGLHIGKKPERKAAPAGGKPGRTAATAAATTDGFPDMPEFLKRAPAGEQVAA